MTEIKLKNIQDDFTKLINKLQIKHIIYIDDIFGRPLNISELLKIIFTKIINGLEEVLQKEISQEKFKLLENLEEKYKKEDLINGLNQLDFIEKEINFIIEKLIEQVKKTLKEYINQEWNEDFDPDWSEFVITYWKNVEDETKRKISFQIRFEKNDKSKFLEDKKVEGNLKEIIKSSGIGNELLSLEEWNNKKEVSLKKAKKEKTLFLIDENFEGEGGGPNDGIDIVKEVIKKLKGQSLCALFSNKFVDQAYDIWTFYEDRYDIKKCDFIPISKDCLYDDSKFQGFNEAILRTCLNRDFDKITKDVTKSIKDSSEQAIKEIKELDIFKIMKIIFTSSYDEGIWEINTLLRIFTLYQRKKLTKELLKSKKIRSSLNKIRDISSIRNDYGERGNEIWKIRRSEFYEDEDYINRFNIPIELGDIFKIINSKPLKYYILIAPPCDLMVREDGRRKINEAFLVEILEKADNLTFLRKNIFDLFKKYKDTSIIRNGLKGSLNQDYKRELNDILRKQNISDEQFDNLIKFILKIPEGDTETINNIKHSLNKYGSPEINDILSKEILVNDDFLKLIEYMIKEKIQNLYQYYELPYLHNIDSCYVNFSSMISINLDILDYCIVNKKGKCYFSIKNNCPEGIMQHLKNRFDNIIKKRIEDIIKYFKKKSNKLKMRRIILSKNFEHITINNKMSEEIIKGKLSLNNGNLEYNLQRIGRLMPPYAEALLTHFSQYISRPAHPHSFER